MNTNTKIDTKEKGYNLCFVPTKKKRNKLKEKEE